MVLTGPSDYNSVFVKQPDGSYVASTGLEAKLVKNGDGTYTLTWNSSEEKWAFNSGGTLTKRTDRNGNHLDYAYGTNSNLASITDTQGRVDDFDTSTGPARGSRPSPTRPRGCSGTGYTTPSCVLMLSSTDPEGKVTQYGYGGPDGSQLTSVTDPRSNATTSPTTASAGSPTSPGPGAATRPSPTAPRPARAVAPTPTPS